MVKRAVVNELVLCCQLDYNYTTCPKLSKIYLDLKIIEWGSVKGKMYA